MALCATAALRTLPMSHKEAEMGERKGGYDCEFVEPPKELQTQCFICLQILRDPHLISCCGHNFCALCISRVEKDGKPCPLCNASGFTTMANKGLKRTLLDYQVRCPNGQCRFDCLWVGELRSFDEHLNIDPQPKRQLEGCQFVVLVCTHCKGDIRRDMLAEHQFERCPKRPYTCEHCEEYKSIFEDVAYNHWPECKCFLLPCPNKCTPSGSGIERQRLDHHLKEECPLALVQCALCHAGCEVTLPRKDMADHMKDESIVHISLLAVENSQMSQRLVERETQVQYLLDHNEQLTQQNVELNDRFKQLEMVHKELAKELKVSHEVLDGRVFAQSRQLKDLAAQCQDVKLHHELIQTPITPIEFKLTGYDDLKKSNTRWTSPPFYSNLGGYKMHLVVVPNGLSDSIGTHVSVYIYIRRGEWDSCLKWPFRGQTVFMLLNQLEDEDHHTVTIDYDDSTPARCADRVTAGEQSRGCGCPAFISHTKLDINEAGDRQYLKNDCLCFQVSFKYI